MKIALSILRHDVECHIFCYNTECHSTECRNAECGGAVIFCNVIFDFDPEI